MVRIELGDDQGKVLLLAALIVVDNAEWLGEVLGVDPGLVLGMASGFIVKLIIQVEHNSEEVADWLDKFKKNVQNVEVKMKVDCIGDG